VSYPAKGRYFASARPWPLAASAQQPAMPVIGFLDGSSPPPTYGVRGFHKGLSETGYAAVVYMSVGRQARVADTAAAHAEAIAAETARIASERARLTKLRNDAQAMLDEEQAKYNELSLHNDDGTLDELA
jgi:hypothetical protein